MVEHAVRGLAVKLLTGAVRRGQSLCCDDDWVMCCVIELCVVSELCVVMMIAEEKPLLQLQ